LNKKVVKKLVKTSHYWLTSTNRGSFEVVAEEHFCGWYT